MLGCDGIGASLHASVSGGNESAHQETPRCHNISPRLPLTALAVAHSPTRPFAQVKRPSSSIPARLVSAYAQRHHDPMGDLPFVGPLEGAYLLVSPYTTSPMPNINQGYQLPRETGPVGTFFEDAIEDRAAPLDIGVSFLDHSVPDTTLQLQHALPRQPHNQTRPSDKQPPEGKGKKPTPRTNNRSRKQQKPDDRQQQQQQEATQEPPKPKKRGRKPKQLDTDIPGDVRDQDDLPGDPRRRRRVLERNRVAATKCRLRKRDEASGLASREQGVEEQNQNLLARFDSLTEEIYFLKTQLLRHSDCNCVLIQKYIAKEAKKSADGMMGASSAFSSQLAGDDMSPPDFGGSSGTAESMGLQSPATDGAQTPWTNPFHQASSTVGDEWLDMGIKSYSEIPMTLDHMVPVASMADGGHVAGCGSELFFATETQSLHNDMNMGF